ncbi:nicotinate-nicotinamide nucleotide adenylyltransferase [Vibrio sp. D431a]|uniref:nicotinate-nicotinamide nucleotide adenylyltransferase n=1 Tax=Vibrio sp. D431a TaxID=2837388 RepID=UPI0025537000|nr:nicotinate-nicotinamide nucleotide adenylyltransferase [Vibrio sp. D431a]MDK9790175.1 nicotinate-nicotinamide nucleotide adenylyltransferase [Vibrio sp. D431a]
MKIGVFGSALNPMTLGHVDALRQALEIYDKVIVVASYSHAFGKNMKPFELRLELAQTTINNELEGENIDLLEIEKDIAQKVGDRPIYTYDVLCALSELYPEDAFEFICGSDNVEILQKFHKHEEIISRWGFREIIQRLPIRSTLVRNNVAENKSIEGLVSSSVIKKVKEEYK